MSSRRGSFRALRSRRKRLVQPILENLETRLVLSGLSNLINLNLQVFHVPSTHTAGSKTSPTGILPLDGGSSAPVGYVPQQLRQHTD